MRLLFAQSMGKQTDEGADVVVVVGCQKTRVGLEGGSLQPLPSPLRLTRLEIRKLLQEPSKLRNLRWKQRFEAQTFRCVTSAQPRACIF